VYAAPLNAIDARTRLCAVLGQPVRHSASPAMHNAAFGTLGLNWRYVACEVQPAHLAAAIDGARRMGFMGLNLTVPHKVLALKIVDVVDDRARQWGAINTVVFEGFDGKTWKPLREFDSVPAEVRSHGFNTDVDAISKAISEDLGMEIRGARVLLLGAGGAGRAAALKLAADGVGELFLVNRTLSRADEVLAEIRRQYSGIKVSAGYPSGKVDLVINATSLGLRPGDSSPLDPDRFPLCNARRVFDMIYRPARTKLLAEAEERDCLVANGLSMLLYQGAAAFELWTGKMAPTTAMRGALEKEIYG